jgi:FtsZ-binding cell division protein ZapB
MRSPSQEPVPAAAPATEQKTENRESSPEKSSLDKAETDQEGLPPAAPVATEDIIRERDEQKDLALGRLKEIDELRADRAKLRSEIDGLKAKVSRWRVSFSSLDLIETKLASIPDDIVAETVAYRQIMSQNSSLRTELDRARASQEVAIKEASDLREKQSTWKNCVVVCSPFPLLREFKGEHSSPCHGRTARDPIIN